MSDHPFVYLNHGPLDPDYLDKVDAAWIAFREPVSPADMAYVARTCPEPIHGFFNADEALFYCESPGDVFDATIAIVWGNGDFPADEAAAAAFSSDVERWIRDVHSRNPVAFFIGPGTSLGDDPWDRWSRQQLDTVVYPWLERYLDTHPDLPEDVEIDDDEGDDDWPILPMSRDTIRYVFQCFDGSERRDTLIERVG